MEIKTNVDFGQYKYRDENPISNFFDSLSGLKEIKPPIVEKKFLSRFTPKREYFILQVAEFLGIQNESNRSLLEWHDKRLRKFKSTVNWVRWLLIIGLPFVFISSFFAATWVQNFVSNSIIWIFYLLLLFGNRISFLIIKKYYADTICLMNGLSLMLALFHPDGISTPTNRTRIQKRMDYLANSIIQLTQLYKSTSTETDQFIYDHFHAMENYVRERETLVVLPREGTFDQLKKDLATLLPFLINGNYGDFSVPAKEKQDEAKEVPYWRRVASGILGMLGIVVPVITLVAHYGFKAIPSQGTDAGETNTLIIMMVAWLLLTLDSILKLGLIETFTNIVKSVRELR
jgi:hypothetical protein